MHSRFEIEEILKADLVWAKSRHETAKAEFTRVCRDVPSGIPLADGLQRIQNAGRERTAAQEAFSTALRRFNDFILYGKVPDDLALP